MYPAAVFVIGVQHANLSRSQWATLFVLQKPAGQDYPQLPDRHGCSGRCEKNSPPPGKTQGPPLDRYGRYRGLMAPHKHEPYACTGETRSCTIFPAVTNLQIACRLSVLERHDKRCNARGELDVRLGTVTNALSLLQSSSLVLLLPSQDVIARAMRLRTRTCRYALRQVSGPRILPLFHGQLRVMLLPFSLCLRGRLSSGFRRRRNDVPPQ